MTREEAVDMLIKDKAQRGECFISEALDMAIKALEQEPCEDAISREAVLDLCDSKDPEYKAEHLKEDVECLPLVTPQQKIGKWIDDKCSVCGERH